MSLDLAFDDAQRAIHAAVGQFCRDRAAAQPEEGFCRESWKGLAELGVLALVTPEGEGGAAELVAAMEALGAETFSGPLAASFLATQLLPEKERQAVAGGQALVSVGTPPLLPWAPLAELFVEIDAERAWLARPRGTLEAVETLGGEPWGRAALERQVDLGPVVRGLALADLALAAYLAACGQRLVEAGSEHARARRQFGRPIGDFQAVAHPLADCAIRLGAAASLARLAACRFDAEGEAARDVAAAARLSAGRAALEAAFAVHQVFGAVGVTTDGPVFRVSRRIRQLVSLPPGEDCARGAVLERFGLKGGV